MAKKVQTKEEDFTPKAIEDRLDEPASLDTVLVCPVCVTRMTIRSSRRAVAYAYCKDGKEDCPYRHRGYPVVRPTFRQLLTKQAGHPPGPPSSGPIS